MTPGQLRAVAERRFADATCLLDSRNRERANGAMYMGGFVIECFLKALLLERFPNLKTRVSPATLSKRDQEILQLLYSHELDKMLEYLPELQKKLSHSNMQSGGGNVWRRFKEICAHWTIYARYSPRLESLDYAEQYLNTIREVKKWLRQP